ncbi:MAG: hypothetical protein H6R25_4340 [Proteobacteria bacterium]|nr:hypothetical protein [Pseudomonadota bacterium]
MLGQYTLTLEEQVKNGHLKPLKATYEDGDIA